MPKRSCPHCARRLPYAGRRCVHCGWTVDAPERHVPALVDLVGSLRADGVSVCMVEHHMDVIAQADWVIDLGPGGGTAGGAMACGSGSSALRTL